MRYVFGSQWFYPIALCPNWDPRFDKLTMTGAGDGNGAIQALIVTSSMRNLLASLDSLISSFLPNVIKGKRMKNYMLHTGFVLSFLTAQISTIDMLKYNDQESVLMYVKKYLPKNPIIIEAGGFDGMDTVKMATIWPHSIIHVFEPVPELFTKLSNNIKGCAHIFTYAVALSDKKGSATFYVSELADGTTFGSGSLLAPKEHLKYHKEIFFKKKIEVPTITIDEWAQQHNVKQADLLWLDMQGYELPALMHGAKLLETVKVIYIEVEFVEAYQGQYLYADVKKFLEAQGFEEVARDFNIPPHWFFGNCVFVRKH